LQAYLYRMAHNWIVDQYRREPIRPVELTEERSDDTAGPEEVTGRHLRKERLRKLLDRLTPDQKQVITLKFIEGWENEEIALTLKKPIGSVKSLQHRALASLKKELEREELI
jgi:RNA polymerase sigma-70 factor (ECF subfamily)